MTKCLANLPQFTHQQNYFRRQSVVLTIAHGLSVSNRSLVEIDHSPLVIIKLSSAVAVKSLQLLHYQSQGSICCKYTDVSNNLPIFFVRSVLIWEKSPCLYIMRSWQVKYVESMCPRPLETEALSEFVGTECPSMLNQDFVIVSFQQGEPLGAVRKFLEKIWKDFTVITPAYSEEIREADRWHQIWLETPARSDVRTSNFSLCVHACSQLACVLVQSWI